MSQQFRRLKGEEVRRVLYGLLGLIILFVVSHYVFERAHLYEEVWGLDIPMHIIGGFFIALMTLPLVRSVTQRHQYLFVLGIFIIIAVSWEVFENCRGVVERTYFGLFDTVKDIADGILGVTIGYIAKKHHD